MIGIGHFTFNVKTLLPYEFTFLPAIWDTICHYPLQYNTSTVQASALLSLVLAMLPPLSLLSVNHPVHIPCFFPSLTVVSLSLSVSFTNVISPCTGSGGSSSSLFLFATYIKNFFIQTYNIVPCTIIINCYICL